MQGQSPKALFIEPIKELRDRAMDHIMVHGRPMVLGEEFDSFLQKGSGRSFATLAFTADFLRLMSTCLLADRKLDPLEVQFLFPLIRPACALYGKYRKEYLQFANINRGNIHDFLTFYESDTSLFGFRCPVTRWAGITIANNVATKCGDASFQEAARDHYSRFGDALREVSGGQAEDVAIIIDNMLDHFTTSTDQDDDEFDFDIDFVSQTTDFSCAIVAQQMILNRFGIDKSEAELVYTATKKGWLTDVNGDGIPGTPPKYAGELLKHYGIETHEGHANSSEDIFEELRRGHLVIVGVDAGELWEPDSTREAFEDELVGQIDDHAVLVLGVDQRDPDNPMIVINDPGKPGGEENHYPLAQFLNAWNDSHNHFIATNNPPPNLARDSVLGLHFNEDEGEYGSFLGVAAVGGSLLIALGTEVLGKWIYDKHLKKYLNPDKPTT